MKPHRPSWWLLTLAVAVGCGGSTGSGASGGNPDGAGIDVGRRTQAAKETVASSAHCTSLTPFYWEIGDVSGALASGQGGDGSGTVDPSAPMAVASASKLLFGAFALQQQSLDQIVASGGVPYLNFTSGYDNLSELACDVTATVAGCFGARGNDALTAADVGKFFYNGGHLQAYATKLAGLGPDYRSTLSGTPQLADDIQAQIGQIGLTYTTPGLAGGGKVSPEGYALFLRKILSGSLKIKDHLGEHQVCAWTHHSDCDALFSPVNESSPSSTTNDVSDYRWHYSLAHWVEDDGSFSSPGLFGFYPWIDRSKTYYGIVARYDAATNSPSFASVVCGQMIRAAWMTGVTQ